MPCESQQPVRELLELLLPRRCAGCGASGAGCCASCRRGLNATRPFSAVPQPCPSDFPPCWAGAPYAAPAREVIIAWKDQDRADLSRVLAPLLARTVRVAVRGSPTWAQQFDRVGAAVAVPVPSRAAGTRVRGRFPVSEVLRLLSDRTDGRGLRQVSALGYVRPVRDQAGLGHHDRARNVDGAMRVSSRLGPRLVGLPVILVDDIVTTGSTLAEATRAVRLAGAGPVLAVTLAATERRTQNGPDNDPRGIPPGCSAD